MNHAAVILKDVLIALNARDGIGSRITIPLLQLFENCPDETPPGSFTYEQWHFYKISNIRKLINFIGETIGILSFLQLFYEFTSI